MDNENDSLIVRGVRRAVGTTQRNVGRLRASVSWVRETATTVLGPPIGRQTERWLRTMLEPENVQRMQSTLARVAQFGMERGFRADPDAAQLYELVSFLEERHGRTPVLMCVVEHASSAEAGFRQTLEAGLFGMSQPPGSDARKDAARHMHDLRDVVGSDLLDLLCALAAMESDEPPPRAADERVAYFQNADLPEEFSSLAAKAIGLRGAFEMPEGARSEGSSDAKGLARFVPSFDDPHLRFLTLSQLFFIHSYLARNLIEQLPALMAAVGDVED